MRRLEKALGMLGADVGRQTTVKPDPMTFIAYIDGGARGNPGPAGAGVQIVDSSGHVIFAGGFFLGHQTNNEAEYAGLLLALDLFHAAGASQVCIRSDSELLVRQMHGQYRVKAGNLKPLYERAIGRLDGFQQCKIEHIPREQNRDADSLVNQALDAVTDVVLMDTRNLLARIPRPPVAPTPKKESGLLDRPSQGTLPPRSVDSSYPTNPRPTSPQPGNHVTATVLKSPRGSACPAQMRSGQVFLFADAVPEGLCVQACGALIEAVLAMQIMAAEGNADIEPITATCPNPACGAVFQVRTTTR